MKAIKQLQWISANAVGLAVGFVALLQFGMLIDFGLDWEKHWNWTGVALANDARVYASTLGGWLLGGAILGSAQALVLRCQQVPAARWILATVVAFGVTAVAVEWPLIALGVLGAIPGPVEPLIVSVGGCGVAGAFQYWMLHRRGIDASRWLVLWLVGLVVSVLPTGVVFISLEELGVSINWPTEIFLNGLIVAGVASWMSGRALFAALVEST